MQVSGQENRRYSDKFITAGANPANRGMYTPEDADQKGLILLEIKVKDVKLYLLVDPMTDVIWGAKFFAYGGAESTAIGQAICSLVKGLTIGRIASLTGDDVERSLRENPVISCVPEEKRVIFMLADELIKKITEEYPSARALAEARLIVKTRMQSQAQAPDDEEKAWRALTKTEQIDKINQIIDEDIRDYLHSEGGDIYIHDIEDGKRVMVSYEGACGECPSSLGMTLGLIEDRLRTRVYGELSVIPIY